MGSNATRMTSTDESRKEVCRPTDPLLKPRHMIQIGNWNVRTMYATGKTEQIARELRNNKLKIMGISEARWTGSGKMTTRTGETVIYSGREEGEAHESGVAIMLAKGIEKTLLEWNPVSDRIITARFNSNHIKLTVIHAYAPTNEADDENKDLFYDQLQEEVDNAKKHDMMIVTGDMNAKVGNDNRHL